jgi:hypothetical protein
MIILHPPVDQGQKSGHLSANVPFSFQWRSPPSWTTDKHGNKNDHATLQVVPSDSGNNAGFAVTVTGAKNPKYGSGPSSVSFQFGQKGGQLPYAPDTLYEGTVTADADCAGFNIKLN